MPRNILKREEAKDRTVDEFQPDRNVIDEDLMQNIDKSENEDRFMKNDQRSIKVLVAEHTKDEMQDDECVQTKSKGASGAGMPAGTGKTDCDGSDRGQRRRIDQSDTTHTGDGEGQKSPEISLTRS